MSQNTCCVPGCNVTRKDGITLHIFPNPEKFNEKFNKWVSNVGGALVDLDADVIFANRRVCDKHFEEIYKYQKNRLNRIAIPTLHLMSDCFQHESEETATPVPPSICFGLQLDEKLHSNSSQPSHPSTPAAISTCSAVLTYERKQSYSPKHVKDLDMDEFSQTHDIQKLESSDTESNYESFCDDCKIATNNNNNNDRRFEIFCHLVAEELNQLKPCLQTPTCALILKVLHEARGLHASEIKLNAIFE